MSIATDDRGTWVISVLTAMLSATGAFPGLATAQPAPNSLNAARVIYDGTSNAPQGATLLTADVFWCSGDDKALSRALTASELAASYGVLAKIDSAAPTLPLTIIRTRAIDKDAFMSKLDVEDTNVIAAKVLVRYDPRDENSKLFVDRIIRNDVHPAGVPSVSVSSALGSAYAPNYVSVFVCTDIDASVIGGRLYFQVKNQQQTENALRAAVELRKSLPGLTVVKEVEIVGTRAPSNSELRYFFDDDATVAARIATIISSATSSTVVSKHVRGYESKVRRGTLEAWISD